MRLETGVIGLITILASASAVRAAELKITIQAPSDKGAVFGLIFRDAASFGKMENAVASFVIPVQDKTASIAISGLSAGKYGVKLFQDLNGNQQLDLNLLGIPTEPYGFSNDAMGSMGPPGFDEAALDVEDAGLATVIHLR